MNFLGLAGNTGLLLLMLGSILQASRAADFEAPLPYDAARITLQPQGARPTALEEARLRELRSLAANTVGWTTSHIGPIRSVKMQRLRNAYLKTTREDIPLLIRLLSDTTLHESIRQAVKYLIAMHGQPALDEMDRTVSEHPGLEADCADIREYMKSRPWKSGAH